MQGHLVEDGLMYGVGERQVVLREVVVDELGYSKINGIAVLCLDIAIYDITAVLDDETYKQRLNGIRGGKTRMRKRCTWTIRNILVIWIQGCLLPCLTALLALLFLLGVIYITTNEGVHRVYQSLLVDAETVGTFVDICVACNLVGDYRHAAHYTRYRLGALDRVVHSLEHHFRLKTDEIGLVFLNIFLELLSRMFAREAVGVVAIGQKQHLDVHSLRQEHVGTAHCGMDASLVTII